MGISLLTSHGSRYGLFVIEDGFMQLVAEQVPHAQYLWQREVNVLERKAIT